MRHVAFAVLGIPCVVLGLAGAALVLASVSLGWCAVRILSAGQGQLGDAFDVPWGVR